VPDSSVFEVLMDVGKLKRHKLQGIDQTPGELITAGSRIFHFEVNNLNNSICHKQKSPDQWKESVIVPSYKKGDETDCSKRHMYLSTTCKILSNILLSSLTPQRNFLVFISVDFDATGHLRIIYSAFVMKTGKNGKAVKQFVSYL